MMNHIIVRLVIMATPDPAAVAVRLAQAVEHLIVAQAVYQIVILQEIFQIPQDLDIIMENAIIDIKYPLDFQKQDIKIVKNTKG